MTAVLEAPTIDVEGQAVPTPPRQAVVLHSIPLAEELGLKDDVETFFLFSALSGSVRVELEGAGLTMDIFPDGAWSRFLQEGGEGVRLLTRLEARGVSPVAESRGSLQRTGRPTVTRKRTVATNHDPRPTDPSRRD